MKKVLFDTNILLDIFLRRKNLCASSSAVFRLAEAGKIKGFLSSHGYATVYYILAKELSAPEARALVGKIRLVLEIAEISAKATDLALASPDIADFEDAIQYYTALESGMNMIITRNKKDFKASRIPVGTPEEFLAQ
jgi:predicted nucleic acid-binding protein